ncbi:MAG: glycyl-radical enzyme activating protein [Cloacibacillus sp.]
MASKGSVLRIEKSSIYDGDGLRTVLFLKGCPLRCLWCSTPESQRVEPERGINRDKCTGCGKCAQSCARAAITMRGGRPEIDAAKCVGCLECVKICPSAAVAGYGFQMTADEAVREIAKDELFYFHSGGGVTISGGEPLMQSAFVREVFEGCAKRGIDCAMESSFHAPWSEIEPLLPLLSLLHVDIKHPNNARHKELTGIGNGLILENIRRADASKNNIGIVTRTPLIPGINDADEDIAELAEIVKGIKKLRFMEFLAYHKLGAETYKRLEKTYLLPDVKTPEAHHMRQKAQLFKKLSGVEVKVNGERV